MKLLNLTAAVSVALGSVLPNVCLSQTLGKGAQYPEVSTAYLPNCYVETTDHRILDLSSMCVVPKEADDSSSTDETARSNTKASAQGGAAIQSARQLRSCEQSEEDCTEAAAARAAVVPY